MSVTMMAFGLNSIVAFPVGTIADGFGERETLAGLSVLCLAVVAVAFVARLRIPSGASESPTIEAPGLENDPEATEFVVQINNGSRSVPTIIFPDGSILVEPSWEELRQKFN
jgi:hypothetical protein